MARKNNKKVEEKKPVEVPVEKTPVEEVPTPEVPSEKTPEVEVPTEEITVQDDTTDKNEATTEGEDLADNTVKTVEKPSTFDSLLEESLKNVTEHTRALVYGLENYKTNIDSGDVKKAVTAKYTLYKNIIKIINDEDYNRFTESFNLLNKFFEVDNGRYLGTYTHAKDDIYWTFGVESKVGNNILIELLNRLATPKTRSERLKTINITAAFKYLNENGIRNLSRFYNI